MRLTLTRRYKGKDYTIGTLYVDGVKFCDVLEDTDRGLTSSMSVYEVQRRKVYGKTSIPTGVYPVDMKTVSPKFKSRQWAKKYKGIVPRLQGVIGFSGVLIHPGNTADDTYGCLLVGENKVKGRVVNSVETFCRLMDEHLIPASKRNERITIEVR